MMQNDQQRLRLRVTGRVQGVGFRWYILSEGRRLGLPGWVRNNPDGSVELEVLGSPSDLAAMRARAAKGPPASRVDSVVEVPAGAEDLPARFESRRDAGTQSYVVHLRAKTLRREDATSSS